MTKNFEEIEQIKTILVHNNRSDLAELLKGCWGELSDSGFYGNYHNSTISSYLIYASFEQTLKLDKLSKEDNDDILDAVLWLYPHKPEAPEVRAISFVIDKDLKTDDSIFVSTEKGTEQKKAITFAPSVFNVPNKPLQDNLVSVMMPFAGFDNVYKAIKMACKSSSFECKRADDIWDNSTFIQDIFDLIYTSKIVIVDFTGKNPNVMYETGIAHTLGKVVIPITQSLQDVPSDLRQHRVLEYLNNNEGLNKLCKDLSEKLNSYNPNFEALPF